MFENGADGSASHLKRSCGILMPVFSLPSPHGIGTFGAAAYEFADFLAASGQSYWQVLPLNPTGFGDSPYQCFSSAAGNPYFIDLDMLVDDGLLTADEVQKSDFGGELRRIDYGKLFSLRLPLLRLAAERNIRRNAAEVEQFSRCCSTQIYDYAVFTALKTRFGMKPWTEWNAGKAMPKQLVPAEFVESQADEIRLQLSIQQLFFKQWNRLKNYVNQLGIGIIGDVPIYVALDSADCWANSRHFMLDESFVPTDVAGVPPDYFSPTGQLWGNPLYNWEIHASENYAWWAERLQCAQKLYDVVRIDHFRGFESFWAVPFGETTAENGRWLPAPGMDFVNAVKKRLPGLSFIAEDLGFLTPEVHELVKNSGFPGMSILQFGFNPDANSDYLPHRVAENRVYYTGTHDNAPIMQWFAEASESERRFAEQYLALNAAEGINWGMIRGGMCSPAGIFIAQMQDVLGLSAEGRVNTPGVASGNWQWRMLPHECSAALAEKLREYTRMYGRLHDCGEINYEHNSVVPHEYCGKNADTQKRYKLLVRAAAEYLDSVDN
ncbi:MAG TPA: 4-alpha-glucanotransferase [Clostridia bacterium]|nr:4-alpha-glucanotransferase [Clostridia bacterium]